MKEIERTFHYETEMRIPVGCWLRDRGLTPLLECQSLGNCDVVGCRFERKPARLVEMIAVELKLYRVAEVLMQAVSRSYCASESWVALPPEKAHRPHTIAAVKATHQPMFMDECHGGIGLLCVWPRSVEVVLPAYGWTGRDLSRWYRGFHRRRNEWKPEMAVVA